MNFYAKQKDSTPYLAQIPHIIIIYSDYLLPLQAKSKNFLLQRSVLYRHLILDKSTRRIAKQQKAG